MTTNELQYEYSTSRIKEAQNAFFFYAVPDFSDITIEDGFCPIVAANFEATHAIVNGSAWDALLATPAPQTSLPLWMSLIAAIINLVR